MFGKRRQKEDDDIGPSKGLMKWVNRLFRFVLFPFIHPVWFIGLLVAAVAAGVGIPAYYGIGVAEMPQWYQQQFDKYYHKVGTIAETKTEPLISAVSSEFRSKAGVGVNVKTARKLPGKKEMVAYEMPQIANRRLFQKAKEIPVDVAATLSVQKSADNVYFKRNDALGLTYLDTPKAVSGKVQVVNANELKLEGEPVFLYGIYAAPSSSEGIAALQYLQKNIDGKVIDCHIGAYAADATATAICFYNGININQRLVDLKYSKNVSLN